MPLYTYRYTDAEGGTFDEFQHIREEAFTLKDGRPVERTVQAFKPVTQYGEGSGTKPIEMTSIAVDSPEEVDEFRRRNPGTEISRNLNDPLFGIPVVKSRSEKLRVLNNEGFVETN